MERKIVSGMMLTLLLIGMLTPAFNFQPVKAGGTVYIRADGSVDPPTANITTVDNVTYTFTGNINDEVVVERDDIVVDGAGYAVQGSGNGTGIFLPGRINVTIKNTTVKGWTHGILMGYSGGNTIVNNTVISNGDWGIVVWDHSIGNAISGNTVTSNSQGGIITGLYSNNNTVSGNGVTLNGGTGIQAHNYSCYNTISGNTVTSNDQWGILLTWNSSGNTISGNTVTSNGYTGISAFYSGGNTVTDNMVTNNSFHGISIRTSSGNTLRDNNMTDNRYNFGVWSELNYVSDYIQDIDTSNTADGKPIYYWVNQHDRQIPADAGYVQAVNCVNIRVEDLNLTKNGVGARFVNTTDSAIRNVTALNNNVCIHLILSSGNTISACTITSIGYYRPWSDPFFGPPGWMPGYGIALGNSSGNTLSGNRITNNDYGIALGNSSSNIMSGNIITNNSFGVGLGTSSGNTISGNKITSNDLGVGLEDSSSNIVYHNNFVNNTVQANVTAEYANTWDDGYPSGGNYWSNYNGTDEDQDGIGDIPYTIDANNIDNYPLMEPWHPPPIKIGVLGPMEWIQGQGLKEGAVLAAEEINATGGILGHPVEIITADTLRGQPEPTEGTGIAAAEELIAAGVDFAMGGFRTEAVFGAREVFMNYSCISFIAGAATNELVDCGNVYDPDGPLGPTPPGPCNACVRCNYERYKYLFRVAPVNGSTIARSLWAFHRFVLEDKLLAFYGVNGKVKVAVVSENLTWADTLHWYMTTPGVYNHTAVLGPYANVTYSTRVSPNATDFSDVLGNVSAHEARLLIHVFSAQAGVNFINQWGDMEVEAVPVGINVHSQESNMWNLTGGNCEYETIIAPSGTRTPITNLSTSFWNAYVARWGHDPIYTSHAPYNSIYALKETIEAYGSWPIDPDTMVPLIEQTDRIGTQGRFRYTGPWNATHKGIYHDVFCNEIGSTWTQGYSRPFVVQWKAGKMEVIWPADQSYSKVFRFPPWMCIRVPEDYLTIQEAIDAAQPGASICVSSETYYEKVVVNKTLTLIGEDRSTTIIDGSGNNYTGAALVTIIADDVDMSGFTVTNTRLRGINVENSRYCEVHDTIVCFTGDRGIVFAHGGNNSAYGNVVYNSSAYGAIEAIWSNNNTIYNNLAYFNQWGIATNNGSYNLIYNNTVYSNSAGIHIDWSSTGNMVYNNNISSNTNFGIHVMNQANENIISGNEISGNFGGVRLEYSSNNSIFGNNITNKWFGINLYSSSNNSIYENNITNNGLGIFLHDSNYNSISGNDITNNDYGISLSSSSSNTVSGNDITNNDYGISFYNSPNNILTGNDITNNDYGISLSSSRNNTLTGNNMTGNTYNFGVVGLYLEHFLQDIDTSNTVDGKVVYYLINQRNLTIDPETFPNIGFLGLVNSTNINVRNLKLTKNVQGVLCAFLTDSTIENVNMIGNGFGLYVAGNCSGTVATGNIMSMDTYGVVIINLTSGISLHKNIISNNGYGLYVMGSNNTFIGNTIINNEYGVILQECGGNVFYHNNFINNGLQANVTSGCVNTWDDGYPSGGNYWSNYSGTDANGDGIGDTPYEIDANNTDNYPLMEAWGQGDVNLDGTVDIFDGVPVAAALGAKLITDPQDPRYGEYWHDEDCPRCPHDPRLDINQDGVIDGLDLEIVDNNYGKTW